MHTHELGTVAICTVVSVEKLVLLAFATAAVVHHDQGMKDDTKVTLKHLSIIVCCLTCTCGVGIACHVQPWQ